MSEDWPIGSSGDADTHRGGWAVWCVGLLLLALAGAALGVVPHGAAYLRTGDPHYIADGDGLLYLAWSRAAVLRGEPHLVDAVHRQQGPMMHPRLLFVPPALLGHALGLDQSHIGILWRLLAGGGIALGLYVALRPGLPSAAVALGAAAFLTFSAGFSFGQPGYRDALVTVALLGDGQGYLGGVPKILAHLRVVTPGLAIPVLLVHLGLVLRARKTGDRWATVLAAASLGLLFHVYFYFWTAAFLGGLLAWVVDRAGRRLYATVLLGGLILGAPALWENYRIKAATAPDWLVRTDKFMTLGRFEELIVPRLPLLAWGLCGLVVFRARRELSYLWCVTGAAFACLNHQIITGQQIENFHWVQAAGVPLSVLLALVVVPPLWRAAQRRDPDDRGGRHAAGIGLQVVLPVIVVTQVGLGLWMHVQEVTRSEEARFWNQVDRQYRQDALAIPPGAVVAGDVPFVFLAAAQEEIYPLWCRLVEYSSQITDDELSERLVLNLYLTGTDRDEAEALIHMPPNTLTRESHAMRSEALAHALRAHRLELVEAIWNDPRAWLQRFDVAYVVLPASDDPASAHHLDGLARLVQHGRHWNLWRIRDRSDTLSLPSPD